MTISPDKQDISITINVTRRPAVHGHRRQARRRLPRQGRRVQAPWWRSRPGEPYRAEARRGDDARVRRPLRHLRLRLRAASTPRPRSTAPTARVVVDARRRAAAPRLRAARQRRRQHAHARRGDPPRVPPVRVGAGTTAARSSSRATGSTGSAISARSTSTPNEVPGIGRPGRPDDQRSRRSRPAICSIGAGFSTADKLVADGVDQAGEHLRHRQLPRHRGQHQQVQPRRWCSARSTRTSRSTASRARSISTTAPAGRSTARARSTSSSRRASRCASACRSASSTRCSSASAAERTEIKGATQLPNSYFLYREQFGDRSSSLPLTIGWTRDNRDSALVPTAAATCASTSSYGAARRRQVFPRQPPVPAVHPPSHGRSPRRERARSATARAWTASPTRSSRTSTAAASGTVRGFDQGIARAGRRHRRLHRRQPPAQHQQRALRAGARRRTTTARCACSLYADVGNVWGENEKA